MWTLQLLSFKMAVLDWRLILKTWETLVSAVIPRSSSSVNSWSSQTTMRFYKHVWAGMLMDLTWTFTSSLWSSDGNMKPNYWAPGGHDPKLWTRLKASVQFFWSIEHVRKESRNSWWSCSPVCYRTYKVVLVVVNWVSWAQIIPRWPPHSQGYLSYQVHGLILVKGPHICFTLFCGLAFPFSSTDVVISYYPEQFGTWQAVWGQMDVMPTNLNFF